MKTKLLLTLLGVLAAGAVGLSGTAVAQGKGGGGGNGGGGGGGDGEAPDFGDLIILSRCRILNPACWLAADCAGSPPRLKYSRLAIGPPRATGWYSQRRSSRSMAGT